uniref:Uncharacterized protein n=1 Tax=Arundo donax TaxID=35708 RepID=A0A0A9FTV5_ARUDO
MVVADLKQLGIHQEAKHQFNISFTYGQEKQPTSPLVEQISGDNVLLGTPRSRITITPLSYVHQSPRTSSKAKELLVSTPESMKRSRSGRLIVPRLDPGSQNIVYGPVSDNITVHFPSLSLDNDAQD